MALVVKSAVKAIVSKSKMRISGDFWKALDKKVEFEVKAAIDSAKANGRKTVRGADL